MISIINLERRTAQRNLSESISINIYIYIYIYIFFFFQVKYVFNTIGRTLIPLYYYCRA
jgi:hypothetical protein